MIIRFISIFLLSYFLISCTGLQHTYLGKPERLATFKKINTNQLNELDSVRSRLDGRADSLLALIDARKRSHLHLSAGEINQLYKNFSDQLDYDRVYNSLLHRDSKHKEYLTPLQRIAGLRLLQSAVVYNQSYQKNRVIRRTINRGDAGHRIPPNIIRKSQYFLWSSKIRNKLYSKNYKTKPDSIDQVLKLLPHTSRMKYFIHRLYQKNDRIYATLHVTLPYIGSYLFGNAIGLYHRNSTQKKCAAQLAAILQPNDIILMKSVNHLTDKFIPGYFGHVALWLGPGKLKREKEVKGTESKEKNRKIGIQRKHIVEALRSGVQMSSLKQFADGEVFLILRMKSLTPNQKISLRQNALNQLNKKYDFNFDIESPDLIFCTELVYLAYDFFDWKVQYYMGRYTLFPDDILLSVINDERFEITALLKDGQVIPLPTKEFLQALIKK